MEVFSNLISLSGYAEFLGELKLRIQSARLSAGRAVNRDMIILYWDIGQAVAKILFYQSNRCAGTENWTLFELLVRK